MLDPIAAAEHPSVQDSRTQLIQAAAQVFSVKGFDGASTREICQSAAVNLSAIKYYFGDKAGLYRAVLQWAFGEVTASFGQFDDPDLSFEQAVRQFLVPLIQTDGNPTQQQPAQQQPAPQPIDARVMGLYLYELIKPSAIFPEIIQQTVLPTHQAFCQLLARQLGAVAVDPAIHQLAFAICAMAHDYSLSRDVMRTLAPELLDQPDATVQITDRLLAYSQALLDVERRLRQSMPTDSL